MQNWDSMEDEYGRSFGHHRDSFERPQNYSRNQNRDTMGDGYVRSYGQSHGRHHRDSFERPHNGSLSENLNPLCLLVRDIPLSLEEGRFRELMSADGRQVTKIHFNKKLKPSYTTTFAFVHFATCEDALHAFQIFSNPNDNPLHLRVSYARLENERPDNENMGSNYVKRTPMNYAPSVGRGKRIDLNGPKAMPNIKVETNNSSRKITMESKKSGENQEGLIPNPFLSCFRCGNKSSFACQKCRLPYCSVNCRNSDLDVHENICRRAKGITESLLLFYEDSPGYANSHSATESVSGGSDLENLESNSNQLVKKPECDNKKIDKSTLSAGDNEMDNKKIDKLTLSAGANELVTVINVESLDEFWVHVKKFSLEFSNMEKKFSLASLSPIKSCKPNTICCASYNSKICRAEILEENPSDVLANLLDHGINVTVQKKFLYCLPADCRELPAQALCCKLVNRGMEKINWNEKDVESFKLILESNKNFRAYVVRCYDDVHEVSLTDREGMALCTLLMNIRESNTMDDIEKHTEDHKRFADITNKNTVSNVPKSPVANVSKSPMTNIANVPKSPVTNIVNVPKSPVTNVANVSKSPVDASQNKITMFLPDVLAKNPQLNKSADPAAKSAKVLPTKSLSKSNEYVVKVPFIKSASDLCVQLEDEDEELMKMSYELNVYCNREKSEHIPSIGEFVCSKFPDDGNWYRCKIIKKIKDHFEVEYVDYGNEAIVPQSDIRVLPDKFISPKFGIRVSLSGIKNEDLKTEVLEKLCLGTWQMKVVDDKKSPIEIMLFLNGTSLSDLINNKNKNTLIPNVSVLKKQLLSDGISEVTLSFHDGDITYCHLHSDSEQIVNLFKKLQKCGRESTTPSSLSIGDVICAQQSSDGFWYRASVISDKKGTSYNVFFLDYGNTALTKVDSIKVLSAESLEFPIFTVPLKIRNLEKVKDVVGSFFVKKIKTLEDGKYLVEVKEDGLTPKLSSFEMSSLPENSITTVTVIATEGDIFYVQQVSDKKKLVELENELEIKAVTFNNLAENPSVDDVVCAKYSFDGRWYRCAVKKVSEGKVVGFFIDYGNTETISLEDLKSLPSELCMYPKLCFPIKFKDINALHSKLEEGILTFEIKVLTVEDNGTIMADFSEGSVGDLKNINIPTISSLKTKSLPTNSISKVTIVFPENDIIYVQLVADCDQIEELKQKLLNANKFVDLPRTPVVDEVICAKYCIDNEWYRCVVKEVHESSIVGFFIDYGNTETITFENIKCLPSELCSYPVFSVPIKFINVEALKSVSEATIDVIVLNIEGDVHIVDMSMAKPLQSAYVPTMFSSLEKSCLPLDKTSKVIFKASIDNVHFALKSGDASELEKLNSILLKTKTDAVDHSPSLQEILLVKGKNNLLYRCCIEKADPVKETYKVYLIDEGITEEVKKNELYNLPENCKPFPVFIVKILAETKEAIILNKSYNVKAIKQSSDSVYHAEIFIPYMCSSLKRQQLPINVESDVIFFHKEKNKIFLQHLKDIEIIGKLQTAISKFSPISIMPYKPAVGEVLCARSQLDNTWYRACVEEQLQADEYRVMFIDYGNCENLSLEHLQPIPASLVTFPSLAIPVKFADEKILMSVELEKKYTVIAESNESVQTVRLVTQQTNMQKFMYSSCKEMKWHSGTKDIIIYSVESDDGSVFCAPYDIKKIAENLELINHITNHVQKNGIPFDECEPESGEMVLAQYLGEWYRGTIVVKSDSGYIVNFVDFGNTEELNLSCLRKMDDQFMEHEIQTQMCTLTGFTYKKENLPQIVQELKQFVYFETEKILSAQIHVEEDEITANIPSITSHLLEKKLVAVS